MTGSPGRAHRARERRQVRGRWRVAAALGVATTVLGALLVNLATAVGTLAILVALAWPGITLLTLAVAIGRIGASLTWRRSLPMWGLWPGLGVVTLLIGLVAVMWPDLTILTPAVWLGLALVVRGIGALWFGLQLHRAHRAVGG